MNLGNAWDKKVGVEGEGNGHIHMHYLRTFRDMEDLTFCYNQANCLAAQQCYTATLQSQPSNLHIFVLFNDHLVATDADKKQAGYSWHSFSLQWTQAWVLWFDKCLRQQ